MSSLSKANHFPSLHPAKGGSQVLRQDLTPAMGALDDEHGDHYEGRADDATR